ncbi:Transcriptional regulator, GntR family / Aspartate aminotransferase [Ruminococcaceae bacterium BL-4]|jgi:2-aminoadipate transaminase|nr:Transcriptional regulator, GntR family / Aspartate aminotransferase [Ruminococcaceae bacterium BL-4]
MDYQFADRVMGLKPSAIREILKYASDPNVISLSAGNPAPEAFPVVPLRECSTAIMKDHPIDALQYSVTEGLPALREDLREILRKGNIYHENDELIITSGAQQIMDLASKSLLNEGDVVLCEEPSFLGALNTFRSYNARLRGIPLQDDGLDLIELEKALREESRAKFLYIIPNFQNPTGITTSWEKRKEIYRLAQKYNILIIEDNPYGELRFAGEPISAIKTLDTDNRVLYCGTFSKIVSPGMRVGYAVCGNELIQKMVVCKQGQDVHTNIWSQMVIHRFLTHYDLSEHLTSLRTIYRNKYSIAEGALAPYQELMPYRAIEGGLFIWCTLPDSIPMLDFCAAAVKECNVCAVPGNAFYTDDTMPCQSFRINYSSPTDEELAEGIHRLGELAKGWKDRG